MKSLRVVALAVVVVFGLALSLLTAAPAQAANPTDGFDAGNIVSDALFYDGNAMSASQVQSFLNQQVPECWLGRPGYEVGKEVYWGGPTTLASKCTRDYTTSSQSQAANQYCAAYSGSSSETAAQIIAKVGKACGISQRALLIMLEKEQSLITDPWPNNNQYFMAMGYACPDTGPGGTANCDPSRGGFAQQVYRAAWQLKVYKAFPNDYRYRAFQDNTIQWHPTAACGTSQVYIKNAATAALYIYTPYRPNAAALRAGWGTGDSCSSYGNRNFYSLWKSWFGIPNQTFDVTGAIFSYWEANKSWLGQPVAAAVVTTANGGGRTQNFVGGTVFEPNVAGSSVSGMTSASPILAAFKKAGGVAGPWGWPTAAAKYQGSSGNNTMQFQRGVVAEIKNIGVYLVPSVLVAAWEGAGGFAGAWGYPTADSTSSNGTNYQAFQKMMVGRAADGKVIAVPIQFGSRWIAEGGMSNPLGEPTGSVIVVSAGGGGESLNFQRGSMLKSKFGTFSIASGPLRDAFLNAGGPAGTWGWPIGRYLCDTAGTECSMPFANGVGVWASPRGVLFTAAQVPTVPDATPLPEESVAGGVS